MGSFWGEPSAAIRDDTTAKLVETIRKVSEKQSKDRRLFIATNTMKAVAAVVVEDHGPKEALAILDALRTEIMVGAAA